MSAAAATIPVPNEAATGPASDPWIVAIVVTLATFMELLDTAIANVALPHIAGGLAVSYDESTWVPTSYLVSNAVVLPLSAWLSRVFGRKRYYMCRTRKKISKPKLGALEEAGLRPWSKPFWWTHSRQTSGPRLLPSTAWQLSLHLRSVLRWAVGSPIAGVGAGFSSSTFPSESFR
jgi:MFS family permease